MKAKKKRLILKIKHLIRIQFLIIYQKYNKKAKFKL